VVSSSVATENPLILLVNDDGIESQRLRELHDALTDLARCIVVAPDRGCSGTALAISLPSRLFATEVRPDWWSVHGTPSDCATLGALHICPRVPDITIAGTNTDFNLGVDVLRSGTVGAAITAYLLGSTAIALSAEPTAPSQSIREVARHLVRSNLARRGHCVLNVNVPAAAAPEHAVATARRTVVARGGYDLHVEVRRDDTGPHYCVQGKRWATTPAIGEDRWAVSRGLVSISKLESHDFTRFLNHPTAMLGGRRS
jgi:5'-nucleotidase